MNLSKVFYMNYMENGGAPTYKFTDIASAKAEAKRLVKLHGKPVYTLATLHLTKPPLEFIEEELIKFECKEENGSLPF